MKPRRMAVFMAGGRGERFWPLSRVSLPKHLVPLFDGKTLIELSVERVKGLLGLPDIRILTSRPQEKQMRKVMKRLPAKNILAEPMGRDTAAAVALATRWVQKNNPGATIAMLPADHLVRDTRNFQRTLEKAFRVAEETHGLVTIGILPTRPATGYGYLKMGNKKGPEAFNVASFKEKPDEKTAREYLASGQYLWNAGIFVWTVAAIVEAFEKFAPEIWNSVKDIDPNNRRQLEKVYPTLKKISIDYAVMEKAANVFTVPAEFDWDDIGDWPAWARMQKADAMGNATRGQTILHESSGSIVLNNEPKHLLAILGAKDLIVVHTRDATLVAPKEKAQELKALMKKIEVDEALKKFTQ